MSEEIAEGVRRLHQAAEDGRLAAWAGRQHMAVVTLFGSARLDADRAHDIDIAFACEHGHTADLLDVLGDLAALTGTEHLDVLALDKASPTARYAGVVLAVPLFEARDGLFSRLHMQVNRDFFDTQHLRDAALRRLAS